MVPDDTASPMWYPRNAKPEFNEETQNEEHTIKKGVERQRLYSSETC